jgi:colanic acid/amylovoran biosynthesis protein
MKSPRFLLVGIFGVYNYGCEAIVRGTVRMLRERWPDCRIVYASFRKNEDEKILADVDISVVKAKPSLWMLRRIFWGVLRRLRLTSKAALPYPAKLLSQCDIVMSIGGDLYTVDQNARGNNYKNFVVEWGDYAISKHKKYVLWGASVGPFDDRDIRNYFQDHLHRVSLITAREEVTVDYLDSLGSRNNVLKVADPAFLMPTTSWTEEIPRAKDEVLVGINLSLLSLTYCFPPSEIEAQKTILAKCLAELMTNEKIRLILIPHVVPGDGGVDDDYAFLKDIYNRLGLHQNRVTLLPEDLGARKTKGVLEQCDAVVAARMHCGIAAASVGTPVLFLQYSAKARGLARYIYGNDQGCTPLDSLTPELLKKQVEAMLSQRHEIRNQLAQQRPSWESEAEISIAGLDELWNKTSINS